MNVSEYKKLIGQKPKKAPKYKNRKTVFMGLKFDSEAEASRYGKLIIMEKLGQIRDLQRQVPLQICKGVKLPGATRARPPIRLIVDFSYERAGQRVYEDMKGMETPLSLAKRHLLLALHGITVELSHA